MILGGEQRGGDGDCEASLAKAWSNQSIDTGSTPGTDDTVGLLPGPSPVWQPRHRIRTSPRHLVDVISKVCPGSHV